MRLGRHRSLNAFYVGGPGRCNEAYHEETASDSPVDIPAEHYGVGVAAKRGAEPEPSSARLRECDRPICAGDQQSAGPLRVAASLGLRHLRGHRGSHAERVAKILWQPGAGPQFSGHTGHGLCSVRGAGRPGGFRHAPGAVWPESGGKAACRRGQGGVQRSFTFSRKTSAAA